jgi:hypothetical protein
MSETPTRPFGYVSAVIDVTTGLLYHSSEVAMRNGALPVNLVVVGGSLAALKRIVQGLQQETVHAS